MFYRPRSYKFRVGSGIISERLSCEVVLPYLQCAIELQQYSLFERMLGNARDGAVIASLLKPKASIFDNFLSSCFKKDPRSFDHSTSDPSKYQIR